MMAQWAVKRFENLLKRALIRRTGTELHTIGEQYTSQICPRCGAKGREEEVKRIGQVVIRCGNCVYENNADLVGAINITTKQYRNKLLEKKR